MDISPHPFISGILQIYLNGYDNCGLYEGFTVR